MEKNLLLAGFEKFGPYSNNVAEILVRRLDGEILEVNNGTRLRIAGVQLPINFRTFREVLREELERLKPSIAVGLGMDFKDSKNLAFEFVAHRRPEYGEDFVDVEGNHGQNTDLDDLDQKLRLPNEERLKSALKNLEGLDLYDKAGRHMCETVLRDLIRLSDGGKKFQPAFVHLPHIESLLPDSKQSDEHRHWRPIEEQEVILRSVIKRIAIVL